MSQDSFADGAMRTEVTIWTGLLSARRRESWSENLQARPLHSKRRGDHKESFQIFGNSKNPVEECRYSGSCAESRDAQPAWITEQAERPARLIHLKVNVLQLFVSLNLQNDRITRVEPTHSCPQLFDRVHGGRI
jgi:hypothetical protein